MSADKQRKTGGTQIGRRMSVSDSLASAVLGADYATPRKVRKIPRRGPRPADAPPRSCPPSALPDAVVLEVRRLHEHDGMRPGQIAIHIKSMGWPMDCDKAFRICEYTTRAHLIPAADAPPCLERKTRE